MSRSTVALVIAVALVICATFVYILLDNGEYVYKGTTVMSTEEYDTVVAERGGKIDVVGSGDDRVVFTYSFTDSKPTVYGLIGEKSSKAATIRCAISGAIFVMALVFFAIGIIEESPEMLAEVEGNGIRW